MSYKDFIDEEDIKFKNELKNPKKYHYEEHSDDIIYFYKEKEKIDYDEVVDLLNEQDETIKELDKYCTACDDTLLTIQELTYKLLNSVFADVESKADYCRLLNELDNKDLSFIHDCIKAINKCDLMGMDQLKMMVIK